MQSISPGHGLATFTARPFEYGTDKEDEIEGVVTKSGMRLNKDATNAVVFR